MTKITQLQENFCQCIVDGLNETEAYKAAGYSFENMQPDTVYQAASRLAANCKVIARIQELREAVTAAVTEKRVWDSLRLIDEAETNLPGAREDHAWAPANSALQLIGRTAGLLEAQPQAPLQVTKLTVVLSGGRETKELRDTRASHAGVVDSTGRVLDPAEEEPPT